MNIQDEYTPPAMRSRIKLTERQETALRWAVGHHSPDVVLLKLRLSAELPYTKVMPLTVEGERWVQQYLVSLPENGMYRIDRSKTEGLASILSVAGLTVEIRG